MVFDSLILRARGLTKSYGSESVLKNFNIDIWEGSIFGILGTSGSGKTTALRMLAGFEIPDSGSIEMYDKIIFDEQTNVPPEKRNIGMVFQDYALFPHLNVEKNIAFGLSKADANSGRLKEVIEMCNLTKYKNKNNKVIFIPFSKNEEDINNLIDNIEKKKLSNILNININKLGVKKKIDKKREKIFKSYLSLEIILTLSKILSKIISILNNKDIRRLYETHQINWFSKSEILMFNYKLNFGGDLWKIN